MMKKWLGLLSTLINNLSFTFNAPGYNFLCPEMKIDKRLDTGDVEINPLDEVEKEHDIWYRSHLLTEHRWSSWQRSSVKSLQIVQEKIKLMKVVSL